MIYPRWKGGLGPAAAGRLERSDIAAGMPLGVVEAVRHALT
jgi:hypothetical protein